MGGRDPSVVAINRTKDDQTSAMASIATTATNPVAANAIGME
jgi:hypothetical protein